MLDLEYVQLNVPKVLALFNKVSWLPHYRHNSSLTKAVLQTPLRSTYSRTSTLTLSTIVNDRHVSVDSLSSEHATDCPPYTLSCYTSILHPIPLDLFIPHLRFTELSRYVWYMCSTLLYGWIKREMHEYSALAGFRVVQQVVNRRSR